MNRYLIISCLFFIIIWPCTWVMGQTGPVDCLTAFTRYFGNQNTNEEPFCVVPFQGNNFLIGGHEDDHSILLLVDPAGNILLQRAFNFTAGNDFIANMIVDNDGFIVGSARDQLNSQAVNVLFKYNLQSNSFVWTASWKPIAFSRIDGLYQNPASGNYCFHGGINNVIDDFLMEIDQQTGNQSWFTRWDFGGNADVLIDNYVDNTGVYFAGEGRLGEGLDAIRPTLMKFDFAGNLLWSRIHLRGATDSARLYNMALFIENDTIVNLGRGSLIGDDLTYSKMFLYKTDMDGHLIWAKSYAIPGGNTVAGIQINSILGGYIAQGTYNEGGNNERMFITRLTKNGDVVWAKQVNTTVEAPGLAKPLSVVTDSFVVFASQTTQFDNNWNYDILFGKIPLNASSDFNSCSLIENVDLVAETLEWPNVYDADYQPTQVFSGHASNPSNITFLPVGLMASDIPDCDCQALVQDSCDLQLSFQIETACPLLYDGSVTAMPSGGAAPYTFTWQNDTVFTNQLTHLDVGVYYVTVTDILGCTMVDSVTLGAAMRPEVDSEVENVSCFRANDGSLTIVADDPSLVFSVQGSPFSTQTFYDSIFAGGYQYFVKDTFGCVWEKVYFITGPNKIVLQLPNSIESPMCDSVQLKASSNTSPLTWSWSPPDFLSCDDCPEPLANTFTTTTYYLTVTDSNGCKELDSIMVKVDFDGQAYIPNCFSPNGDGINDVFYVLGKCVQEVRLLRVFDRWGEMVFEKSNTPPNDPLYGWDGKFRGKDTNDDVYLYFTIVALPDGTTIEMKGDLTLLR